MDRPPRDPKEPIITGEMWWGIGVQSILTPSPPWGPSSSACTSSPEPVDAHKITAAQTFAFTTLVLSELFRAFTCRSERVACSGGWAC